MDYAAKLSRATAAIVANDALARAIRDFGLRHHGLTRFELRAYERLQPARDDAATTHAVQAMNHLVRDWSAEGQAERDAVFPPILATVDALFPPAGRRAAGGAAGAEGAGGANVLVPGAGLGRLAYELASRGHRVVANENSAHVLLALRYLLSLSSSGSTSATSTASSTANSTTTTTTPPMAEMHTLHPYVGWWSHHRSTADMLRGVAFPDVLPDAAVLPRLSVVEGDFVSLFGDSSGAFDAVVTLFFIDTARNMVAYLAAIHAALRPGGVWINLGPLLYGTAPWIELSLDEVLRLAEAVGFELQPLDAALWGEDSFPDVQRWKGRVRGRLAAYNSDAMGLSRNAYLAQGWVARKL